MSKRSKIQNGLKQKNGRSGGESGLKAWMNPPVSEQIGGISLDFDGPLLLKIGNTFVRQRYQESSVGVRGCRVVDGQVKTGTLIEPRRKLSQHEKSVRQNGNAEEAENDGRY